ncbi:MAG: putative lipid flippase FtsW [Frankiales bacterium]|nr:putative lipid flippase FtsW [Frankiales bacterium]
MISGLRARVGGARMVAASGRYLETPFASLQLMLGAGGGLLLVGVLMSASTTISAAQHTTGEAMWSQLIRELEFLVLSIPVFWIAVRISPTGYRRLAYPIFGLSLLALVAVLVPGIGVTINGAHRWLQLGPFSVQPSEFAKLGILLWGADLLARKESLGSLTSARHVLLPLVPGFALVIILVMREPDLGTSLCFMLLLMALLWMVGLPLRYFAGIVALIVTAATMLALTEPYRVQRLTTFLHPNLDPQANGFQALGGLAALGSGGIFGVGLGHGTLKYGWVPNANTDYVFAVVGEELGLLGTTAVLLLFGLFAYSAMRTAWRSQDPFVRLVGSGAAVWISGQALINIGYVTALLPVTGIPLPFISNGGTSLILTCGVLGMLISFARHEPAAVKAACAAIDKGERPRWLRWLRLGTPKLASVRRPRARPSTPRPAKPAQPATAKPATAQTSAAKPSRANPSRAKPSRANPASANPASARSRAANAAARGPAAGTARATGTERDARPRAAPLRPTGTDGASRPERGR